MSVVTATGPVNDLIVLSERLAELMSEENELLRAMRPGEIAGLQESKANLSRAYEERMRRLAVEPDHVRRLDPETKATLRRATERLNRAVARNRIALKAAKEANERLIRAIVNAVQEQQQNLDVYTASGASGDQGTIPAGRRAPVSISVNQRL